MGLQDSVKKAVNWDLPYINGEDSIQTVINKMVEYDVNAFVVEINGIVAGILTDIDLLQSITKEPDLETIKVAEVMTPCDLMTKHGAHNPCAQIYELESIENALKVIDAAGTHTLMVAGSGNKAGLVSIHGLLKVAVQ